MRVDPASLLVDGPWEHQFVAANGSRFHVATIGDDDAPLVVLLHGFPQTWYAWRAQLPALAAAGLRVAAVDLRGFGSSDKPPRGHDTRSLAADISGVVRSLGASRAVVVGHGYGAQIAWAMPRLAYGETRAIAVLSSPHPAELRHPGTVPWATMRHVLYAQLPYFPERRLRRDWVSQTMRAWGAPGWRPEAVDLYTDAMRQPAVAHHVLEQARWQVRSTRRPTGRRILTALHEPVEVPVLSLHGALDRCLPPRTRARDAAHVTGPFSRILVPGAGHFLPEEAPDVVSRHLIEFVAGLPPED